MRIPPPATIAAVMEALTEGGIDLPHPTTQALFHGQTEERDGDRSRRREGWPAGRVPPRSRLTVAREAAEEARRRSRETSGARP